MIKTYLLISISLFGSVAFSAETSFFSDKTTADYERVLRADIAALAQLKFENPSLLFKTTFGAQANGVFNYFADRIDRFTFKNGTDGKYAELELPSTLIIYPAYFALDRASRLSFLIHEAAHRDTAHTRCPSPYFFKMTPGPNSKSDLVVAVPQLAGDNCDLDLTGAYGTQYVFLAALADSCSSCSDVEKKKAKDLMYSTLVRIMDPRSAHRLWRDSFPVDDSPGKQSRRKR